MLEAFATADQVLLAGVQGITDLITTPGLINLDFADVKSVMQGAGSALMGIGSARGADRAIKAAELAVASPAARGVASTARTACCCRSRADRTSASSRSTTPRGLVQEAVHPEANIIFGAVIDDTLGDEVRVTVIAAGFDGGEPNAQPTAISRRTTSSRPAAEQRGRASSAAVDRRRSPRGAAAWSAARARRSLPVHRSMTRPSTTRMTTSTSPTSSSRPLAELGPSGSPRCRSMRRSRTPPAGRARSPRSSRRSSSPSSTRPSLVRELAGLGVRDVGENRHQEAQAKAAELADLDLRWHFVGQLQSNKARQVRRYAHAIHSVDRVARRRAGRAATRRAARRASLQLNLTDDPGAAASPTGELEPLAEHVLTTPGLRLRGVMAVAPLGEEPARAFERVRAAAERVRALAPDATAISAGMSRTSRGDRRRRDTPSHRHRNHRESRQRTVNLEATSNERRAQVYGGCHGEPAEEDDGLPGPGRRGKVDDEARPPVAPPRRRHESPVATRSVARRPGRTGDAAAPSRPRCVSPPLGADERDPHRAPAPVPRRAGIAESFREGIPVIINLSQMSEPMRAASSTSPAACRRASTARSSGSRARSSCCRPESIVVSGQGGIAGGDEPALAHS